MPLTFYTRSHGSVPFGFFNIESDMVILGSYFLFASDLCSWIGGWARGGAADFSEVREVNSIHSPERVGNLHGAMRGLDLSGFLGACYERFPFPSAREDFRQKPEGYLTRRVIEELIDPFSRREMILISADAEKETLSFGDYVFEREWWNGVVAYLWRGGLPRWRAEERPPYVMRMGEAVAESTHWLFRGCRLV